MSSGDVSFRMVAGEQVQFCPLWAGGRGGGGEEEEEKGEYYGGQGIKGGVWEQELTLWMAWSMTTMFCPDSICVNTFRPCSEHRTVRFVSKPRAKSGWAFRAFFGFLSSE